MDLTNLTVSEKKKRARRVGRGEASGSGKTSGRGANGQKSRSGGKLRPGFEGGQMPLARRLPKKGFKNRFRVEYNLVHISDLARFEPGQVIDGDALREKGLVTRRGPIKLLSDGEVTEAYTIKVNRVSSAARSKVESAGGSVELL